MSPMVRARYPPEWRTIRARILDRAADRCEFTRQDGSRCNIPNTTIVWRSRADKEHWSRVSEREPDPPDSYLVTITLTVAHLNHDTTNNRDDNLRAGCQLHHLRHDRAQHLTNAASTRRSKKRNLELFS